MNLGEYQEEVRERLGEVTASFTTDGDFWTNDEVRRAINEAQRRFCAEEQWPFLVTEWTSSITTNDTTLALPSNVSLARVFNLSIDGDNLQSAQLLKRVEPSAGFRLRAAYDDYTGAPFAYYIVTSDLPDNEAPPIQYTARLIPPSDGDYDVTAQYYAQPVVMTGQSDEAMVPDEYAEAIAAWATGKLFLKELGISQKSSEQFQVYYKVLAQAQKDLKAHNNLDEVVAWGRDAGRIWSPDPFDPRRRMPPNLG